MYKKIFSKQLLIVLVFNFFFCFSWANECFIGHTKSGTAFGEEGVRQYAFFKHGPDGAQFLDPYFLPFIENVEENIILDAGCGAAPWAIYAAQNGAHVYGIDIQEKMISLGKEHVIEAGMENRIILEVADVGDLPYKNAFFDKAISINVGCNLPMPKADEDRQKIGLGAHFEELARVLKEKGKVIITAPASFEIVFTSGVRENALVIEEIENSIDEVDGSDSRAIVQFLNQFSEIYRATFISKNGKLKLVTDGKDLEDGQEIWRKLPGMAVPNVYHGEKEYLLEAINAGFNVTKISHPNFGSEEAFLQYNQKNPERQLGKEYISNHPFLIIEMELK